MKPAQSLRRVIGEGTEQVQLKTDFRRFMAYSLKT
jgi:hypothetical protein